MLRISGLSVPLNAVADTPLLKALDKLRISRESVKSWHISKKSVDARDKSDIHFVYAIDIDLVCDEQALLRNLKPGIAAQIPAAAHTVVTQKGKPGVSRPVVIGMGPCGLFAALYLARAGFNPIVLERGESVNNRARSVNAFWRDGTLDPESNIQFGEGGAGAFSDGKLTTGIKSPLCQTVLVTLTAHGAPEEIMYLAQPHIGTDKLPGVVASIREEILSLGGSILFGARLTEIVTVRNRLTEIVYAKNGAEEHLSVDQMILALGHSARDTLQMLYQAGVNIVQKNFSVGARIEHRQSFINRSQYGAFTGHSSLGAADYKLSCKTKSGRGAYTFCMCPGGSVIAAASQHGGVCVNGMSAYARNGENANSALLVDVTPEDFGDDHPLAGLTFQRLWEQRAFAAGGGDFRAPVQRVEDFLLGRTSTKLGDVNPTYRPGVTCADLGEILPEFAVNAMREAIVLLNNKMRGFAHPDAVLTGVETRSSSPVRIPRDSTFQSNITGIYPAGEGAGYAGGIMSAAVDGLAVSQALADMQDI